MLVELDPRLGLGEHLLKEALASHQGVRTLVDAVELEQVKGIEDHLIIVGPAMQLVEAVPLAGNEAIAVVLDLGG
jgi:hypothetical protein